MAELTAKVTEQAVLLGPRKSMVGVFTPAVNPAAEPPPAVVILNSGIIHRVGANRMTVLLARALARAGHTVLRFDLSGIGDSEARADSLPPLEASLTDIREVLDHLESTRQIRRVVLVGLCAGADHSVFYAGSDPRVVGVVLMDATIPRSRGYYFNHYRRRLARPRSWVGVLLGRHPLWRKLWNRRNEPEDSSAEPPRPRLSDPHVRAYIERAYQSAVANGVQFLAVFTDGVELRHNYRRQLLDALPNVRFGNQLQLEYFSHCDHAFTRETHRARLMEMIVKWLQNRSFAA